MMYPINLNMTGRSAVIFGGGKVALRKLQRLLEEGAEVTVVAPNALLEIAELHEAGKIYWLKGNHTAYDWKKAKPRLVFAATDRADINHAICQLGREYGAWINSATAPDDCDFQLPSRIKQGHLELTASTDGGSPAFARLLRLDLESRYHEDFGRFLDWLQEVRQELQGREPDTAIRQKLWRNAMNQEIFNLVLNHRLEQAKDEIRRKIGGAGAESSHSTGRDS